MSKPLGTLGIMMKYNIKLPEYKLIERLLREGQILIALRVLMAFKTLDLDTAEEALRAIKTHPLEER